MTKIDDTVGTKRIRLKPSCDINVVATLHPFAYHTLGYVGEFVRHHPSLGFLVRQLLRGRIDQMDPFRVTTAPQREHLVSLTTHESSNLQGTGNIHDLADDRTGMSGGTKRALKALGEEEKGRLSG